MSEPAESHPVSVVNIDGEEAAGELVEVLPIEVADQPADFLDAEDATLHDYWRGEDVDPDERVVRVSLEGGVYDYPESRVKPRTEASIFVEAEFNSEKTAIMSMTQDQYDRFARRFRENETLVARPDDGHSPYELVVGYERLERLGGEP